MNADWFASRLKELREAAGLSRKELALKAGMRSEAGIRNLEQGIRSPSWETVVALCQALGVACDAFLQEPADTSPGKPGRPRKIEPPAAATGVASGASSPAEVEERPAAKAKGRKGAEKGKKGKGRA